MTAYHLNAGCSGGPEGVRPGIFFQQVSEGRTANNRLRLDVRAAPGPRRDEPAPPAGASYIVVADPEGAEFCLD
ncbi:VOC family protein [Streptomyces sp. NBC_00658]|uniref:VOC family protein n=1 Tax=Streptomyces sp. NBC_00658 TaxID=2975800 RepID=UPI00386F2EB8